MNKGFILSILLLAFFIQVDPASVVAGNRKKKAAKETVQKEPETKYEKLFKGKTVKTAKGLITLHQVGKKLYFEYPLSLLGREFLLGTTFVETSDNGNGAVGQMINDPLHIAFTLRDSTLQMHEVTRKWGTNPMLTDSSEEGVQKAVHVSTLPPIRYAFKVETYNPDSTAVVVDMTDFFLKQNNDLTPFADEGKRVAELGDAQRDVKLKEELTRLDDIKAFEDNISIISTETYTQDLLVNGQYLVVQDEPVTVKLNRTLLILPGEDQLMRPRLGDPRVNVVTVERENMTTKVDGSKVTHYMTRWNIQPKDVEKYKNGEPVEPVNPIVFYVDNNFPEGWSDYIKAGVEEWNKAFEAIGFKNVLQVKTFPVNDSTFDPDNMKFLCIRYAPIGVGNFKTGPHWIDPRSGQVINASIEIFHDMLRRINLKRFVQTASCDEAVRTMKLPLEKYGEGLKGMIVHEVGHILGFGHNLPASHAYPTDSLRSATFTQKYGITPSIMDNMGYNYVAQPGDKDVVLIPERLGVADYHTVKVAYQPIFDVKTLEDEQKVVEKWISEKVGDPMYRFDPEPYTLTMFDPTSLPEDLGDDAIKASAYGIKNLQYLMENMNEWLDKEDIDYTYRNMIYRYVGYYYKRYIFNVFMNLGGFYLNQHYVGDPVATFVAVPKDIQKNSLKFVVEQLKNIDWIDRPEVVENLEFDGSKARQILKDFLSKADEETDLFSTRRISLVAYRDKGNYSPEEYLEDLYKLIWEPTIKGRNLTEAERVLQIAFLTNVRNTVDINGNRENASRYYAKSQSMLQESAELVRNRQGNRILEVSGFGSRWLVENLAVDNPNHLWYNLYLKVIEQVKKRQGSGNADTKAHYDYLMFLINRSLRS